MSYLERIEISYKNFDKVKALCIEEGVWDWAVMMGRLVDEALKAREAKKAKGE